VEEGKHNLSKGDPMTITEILSIFAAPAISTAAVLWGVKKNRENLEKTEARTEKRIDQQGSRFTEKLNDQCKIDDERAARFAAETRADSEKAHAHTREYADQRLREERVHNQHQFEKIGDKIDANQEKALRNEERIRSLEERERSRAPYWSNGNTPSPPTSSPGTLPKS